MSRFLEVLVVVWACIFMIIAISVVVFCVAACIIDWFYMM